MLLRYGTPFRLAFEHILEGSNWKEKRNRRRKEIRKEEKYVGEMEEIRSSRG